MNKLDFQGLQPEIFESQEWFKDFTDAYAKSVNEAIRYPIYRVENIRRADAAEDPVVAKQMLNQYGFHTPVDFIKHHYHALVETLPYLPRYSERSGTEDSMKLISAVLGRTVEITPLYTEDYSSFYAKPHGPMQVEGGNWYKTTHVDLGMQLVPGDIKLNIPRGKTRRDRFEDAFFDYAAWSIVVNEFYYIIQTEATVTISGCMFKYPKRYIDVGQASYVLTAIRIEGPATVSEKTDNNYRLVGEYRLGATGASTAYPRKPRTGKAKWVNGVLTPFDVVTLPYGAQRISLKLNPGEFGIFYVAEGAGAATFTDLGSNLEGAWDGATWEEDDVGTTYGPVTVQLQNGPNLVNYLMYRTDFEELGEIEFDVAFQFDYEHDDVETGSVSGVTDVYLMDIHGADWVSNRTGALSIDDGSVEVGSVQYDTSAIIYATYKGLSTSKSITILNDLDRITALNITGDDFLFAGGSAQYYVVAETRDGPELISTAITALSPDVRMNDNVMSVYELEHDGQVTLMASVTSSKGIITASKTVELRYKDFNHHVVSLRIEGPSELLESAAGQATCWAMFSNGQEEKVIADWDTSCSSVVVTPSGHVTTGTTEGDLEVKLTARYQFKSAVVEADHTLSFLTTDVNIIKLEVVGNHQVIENQTYRYAALATLSNGRKTYVDADWSCTRYRVDEQGNLYVGRVGIDPIQLTITANVDGVNAFKEITAIDTPVTLLSISVEGPDNVREGSSSVYFGFAHYSNGQKVKIIPEWRIKNSPSWAAITQEGMLSFSTPLLGILEIEATHRIGERIYSKGKPIVVVPKTRIIRGLFVNGPNEVEENKRIQLQATAVYSDGSSAIVEPVWEVRSADPLNLPEVMADIVSPGVLQGRYVDEETIVVAVAKYFNSQALFEITVLPTVYTSPDIPVSSRIIGPPTLEAEFSGSYSHAIVFQHCPDELLVSSTWSLDVDKDVATISAAGFLQSTNGKSATVTVTSVYECHGITVIDSIVVRILGEEDKLEALFIEGPEAIPGSVYVTYKGKLQHADHEALQNVQPEWSITPYDPRVSIDADGRVYVADSRTQFYFTIKAVYTQGFETVTAVKDVSVLRDALPSYGIGPIGIKADPEISTYLTKEIGYVNSAIINLSTDMGEFMYLCYPVAKGLATFRDTASDFVGGWDGASWPDDGDIGSEYGPIVIQRTINGVVSDWYLYRTDFEGLGPFEFEVTFGG